MIWLKDDYTNNEPVARCGFCGCWHNPEFECWPKRKSVYDLHRFLSRLSASQMMEFIECVIREYLESEAK